MPEIGLLDAGRQDQVVILEFELLAKRAPRIHPSVCRVDPGRLGQHELDVAVTFKQLTQRDRDLPIGQDAGGVLVEQGWNR